VSNPFEQLLAIGQKAGDPRFLELLGKARQALESGDGKTAIRSIQGAWMASRKAGFAEAVHPFLAPLLQMAAKMDDREFATRSGVAKVARYLFGKETPKVRLAMVRRKLALLARLEDSLAVTERLK
jgi:hypothetical protein